jgi:hypothetical protein
MVALASVIAAGCAKQDEIARPTSPETSAPSEVSDFTQDLTKVKPDFSLTPEQYFADHKIDGPVARKYTGKIIELTGKIKEMGYDEKIGPYVDLPGDPPDKIGRTETVRCATVDREPWAKTVPGTTVKIRGRWQDFGWGKGLANCVFIDLGPSPAISISATQLANEWQKNNFDLSKKYRYLIVEGQVIQADSSDLVLKGNGDVEIKCLLSLSFKPAAIEMMRNNGFPKRGQEVKVVGELSYFINKTTVLVRECCIVSQPK